jgi:hypothetical protein
VLLPIVAHVMPPKEKFSSYARGLSKGAVKKSRQLRTLRVSIDGISLSSSSFFSIFLSSIA